MYPLTTLPLPILQYNYGPPFEHHDNSTMWQLNLDRGKYIKNCVGGPPPGERERVSGTPSLLPPPPPMTHDSYVYVYIYPFCTYMSCYTVDYSISCLTHPPTHSPSSYLFLFFSPPPPDMFDKKVVGSGLNLVVDDYLVGVDEDSEAGMAVYVNCPKGTEADWALDLVMVEGTGWYSDASR